MSDKHQQSAKSSISVSSRHHSIILLAVTTRFLQWGILGILIPVSNLLRMSKGLTLPELGFSAAITAGIVVALELPTGVIADRIGRKRTYLASLAFMAASCTALLFASGFAMVSMAFALYGVSRALSSGSLEALMIDRYIEANGDSTLHRLMSFVSAADTAGLALGCIAGGYIPGLWTAIALNSNRYQGNLLVMLVLLFLLTMLVVFSVAEEKPDPQKQATLKRFMAESLSFIRFSPALLVFLGAGAAWGIAFSAIETYWQPQVASIVGSAGSDRLNGFLSAGYFLAALIGSLWLCRQNVGNTRRMVHSCWCSRGIEFSFSFCSKPLWWTNKELVPNYAACLALVIVLSPQYNAEIV
ncbi:MAG: MFS transporter [Rectinema subterraneum]|uniref:MFS transporter n=1 Tax=Rectinema subterraneum TaxID=2653714 RepID=UPI003C7C6662